MTQLQKVLWAKGLILNPQHLQLQDSYLEQLIEFRLGALTFAPWGFSRLEIDRQALAAGTLVVSDAAGLLPDGLIFDVPGADPAPPPLPLAEHWAQDQNTMIVYLAIPEHRHGGLNVSASTASASESRARAGAGPRAGDRTNTRYHAEVVMRRDENTGLAEKPVQVARRNLRLIAEGEALEGYSALPVARVLRTKAGLPELDESFVPPLVDITASHTLMSIARRLVELLSARSSSLSSMRRQRNQGLADFGVSDIANFWLLYTMNTHLPRFRHIYETRRGHPSSLYSAMLELAGTLMTFAPGGQPGDLPEYDHGDLTGCFGRLDPLVRQLIETAVPSKYVSLPLKQVETSVYAAALDQDRYFAASQIYLAVGAGLKPADLARRVPQLLKVSSADGLENLIRRALSGVTLTHVPNPPSALPVKLNFQYFLLERSGDDWDGIRRSRHLAVYAPADLPGAEMELLLDLPEGA